MMIYIWIYKSTNQSNQHIMEKRELTTKEQRLLRKAKVVTNIGVAVIFGVLILLGFAMVR